MEWSVDFDRMVAGTELKTTEWGDAGSRIVDLNLGRTLSRWSVTLRTYWCAGVERCAGNYSHDKKPQPPEKIYL